MPQFSRGCGGSSRARPPVLLLASPGPPISPHGPPSPKDFFMMQEGGVSLPRMLWHKKPEICTTDPVRHCTPRRERAKANFDRGGAEPGPPARQACVLRGTCKHAYFEGFASMRTLGNLQACVLGRICKHADSERFASIRILRNLHACVLRGICKHAYLGGLASMHALRDLQTYVLWGNLQACVHRRICKHAYVEGFASILFFF